MPAELIDFAAKEAHFFDHLYPLWRAIPVQERGQFFVHRRVQEHATARGLTQSTGLVVGDPTRMARNVTVVSSWGDLNTVGRTRRRPVLAEHGAGQSYSSRHTSYVGGRGRERVELFLVPGHAAAARNRRYYSRTPNAVIGSPRLDDLARIPLTSDCTTVALSFHWRALTPGRDAAANAVVPEASTAVDHYLGHLGRVAEDLRAEGIHLIGHAHPRMLTELQPHYERAGIEVVSRFEEVVARADLYAVDNSSTLFEFAALGRPVVVLNCPQYRRDVEHGLRFWSEADVGLQVNRPGELSTAILHALEDPPSLRASREAAVARVYAVTDGTAARRGALAVRSLAARRCLVCGAHHAVCKPARDDGTEAVDIEMEDIPMTTGRKRLYRNPDNPSSFIKLSDRDAKRLGLLVETPGDTAPLPGTTAEEAAENASTLMTSAKAAGRPAGALAPAGPTHRARNKKRSEPVPGDELVDDAAQTEAEADAQTQDEEPVQRTTRRRRRKVEEPEA